MSVEKKTLPTFKIYSPADLGKDWFIFYSEGGKRKKVKGGINRLKTFDERMSSALTLRAKLEAEYKPVLTLRESMLAWADSHEGHWKKKTYQTIKSRIDCLLDWLDKKEVTNETLRDFFTQLACKRHARTHNEYLYLFKRIFKVLEVPEILKGVEAVKAVSTPAKYFQSHQIAQIKEYLLERDPMLWFACEFLYYTFIRPGELRLVKISDIHFDEWKICVRASISKNKKEQYVTIPEAFRPSLEQLKFRSSKEYVFFWRHPMEPLPVNSMQKRFRKVLEVLGFGLEYQFYSWKHTGAVACVKAGASLKELQIQLRHHSLEEVDKYIRQLGVNDLQDLEGRFPGI